MFCSVVFCPVLSSFALLYSALLCSLAASCLRLHLAPKPPSKPRAHGSPCSIQSSASRHSFLPLFLSSSTTRSPRLPGKLPGPARPSDRLSCFNNQPSPPPLSSSSPLFRNYPSSTTGATQALQTPPAPIHCTILSPTYRPTYARPVFPPTSLGHQPSPRQTLRHGSPHKV